MKFKTNKQNLISEITKVQNIVSSKVTIPILNNVLLKNYNNKLTIYATDLDMGITCEFVVDTIDEGAITIPAKRFYDIIRELPDGDVLINAKKNNHIDIEGVNCRFKLNGLSEDDFPKIPEFDKKQTFKLDQPIIKSMIKQTVFAVSHEESRFVFNGILLEIEDKVIRMVATDGRRLAKIDHHSNQEIDHKVSVIIPLKAIHEILKNLLDEGTFDLFIGKNQLLFKMGDVMITTRIIEGDFPNYNQVIPSKPPVSVKVNKDHLLSAIKRANLLTTPDFQVVKFEIYSDRMVISKNTPDIGESREEIAVTYKGEELAIGFNPVYLIDFLKNIDQDEIELDLVGVDKPAVVRLEEYLYLVLPMRI